MAETPGRLQVEYFDGSNWVALVTNGNSLILELEITDTLYSPQTARFKVADLKNNGIFAASATNSVLKEFMNIRILDADKYIIYFSGKIFRMTKSYQVPYGEVIEATCYDALFSLGNEFLDTDSDSIAASKAHTLISTWIGNHISTSLLSVTNDSGDVDRFEVSAYNRANTAKVVKAGRSQISVLAAILQEALQDQILTAKDRGYIYYVDPNFTSTATSHNPAGFFNYFARNRMPANGDGTSGAATPVSNGLTIEKPVGVAISETGTKQLMMSRLDISSSNRELATDIIASYYHEETGKRVSKRFSIIHYTAISGMAAAQYAGIGFDVAPGTGGSAISNLVDSGNNIIGRIQYMSTTFSADSIPGFMILSDRTSHALVAGETLSADAHGSGVSLTLSSVDTIGSQYVYEPKAVWGVTKTIKSNFDKESSADEIRSKLAGIFEGRQNVPDRLSFTTSQLPYYWAEGRATSSTTGGTLHDSAVNWETKGVRTGASFLKLSGTGGTVAAYGYVSSLTDAGVITCTLNTGTWAVNDYYRWQVRVRAGHQVHIKCVPKGISGEAQIVTRVTIQQNMGSQTLTSWETQGAAARSIPTDLAESTTTAATHSAVNTGASAPVSIGDVPAKLTSVFAVGAKSSPNTTRHLAVSWTAGTLKLNKSLTIDGNEVDEYTINNQDTTSITGVGRGSAGALTPGTEYTLYFDPDTDPNDFQIAETTDYQSVDRSRLKIARIAPVSSTGGSGDGLESECLFELQSTIILEGASDGEAGASMKLGADYFAVDGIQAKHMLVIGSDATADERFKFNTPSSSPTSASSAHWFRAFTGNSSSDTTGKWLEIDVGAKALNFYNGAATSLLQAQFTGTALTFYKALATTATTQNKLSAFSGTGLSFYDGSANGYLLSFLDGSGLTFYSGDYATARTTDKLATFTGDGLSFFDNSSDGFLLSQFTGTGVTFYDGTYATARDADRTLTVGDDGVILYEGAALGGAAAPLKFLNDATTAANAANIGLQGNEAYSSLAIMGAAGVNTGSAIQFQVANRSYGSGTTASAGVFKIGFGDTTYVNGHTFRFSGNEGYDLTLEANFRDTSGNGTTTYGHVVLENYTGLLVEDGGYAAPSITFDGSAGKDTGLFYYETGGIEYLGVTANGSTAVLFGQNNYGIYFYENIISPYGSGEGVGLYYCGTSTNPWHTISYNNLNAVSDERLKENIISISDAGALDFVTAFTPRSFNWKTETETRYGLIAQEVKSTLDELGISNWGGHQIAIETEDQIQSLDLTQFIPPLIGAVKELKKRLEKLEGEQ
jgi:hypothetical protein